MPRAVRFDHYGDRNVLYIADVDIPTPAEDEILVRVRAAGINPGEIAIRAGAVADRFPATFPSGEGSDLAGVITAVGSKVTAFSVGDDVLGWSHCRSSHADYVTVPVGQLIPKPPQLSWAVAGSLYVVGCTAYAAVRAVDAKAGDVVAVSAAAGGVGSVVTQLLRIKGATVLGIASAGSSAWLIAHGAIPIAYGNGLADRLRAAAPNGIDAFIDLYGPEYVQLAIDVGIPPGRVNTVIAREKARQLGANTDGSMAATNTHVLADIAGLVTSGQIDIPIAATYALEHVRDAYAELEHHHTRGKIVLIP